MRELGDTPEVDVVRPFQLLKSSTAVDCCQRCGVSGDTPLSVARFEAWQLEATRTLCDFCANLLFEVFIETDEHFAEQASNEGALALIR